MRTLRHLAACLALLAPAGALAFGVSLSAAAGSLTREKAMKGALEVTPFQKASIFHFELPIEARLAPSREFATGPGLKIFLRGTGGYARVSYLLGNLGHELTQTAVVGVGRARVLGVVRLPGGGYRRAAALSRRRAGADAPRRTFLRVLAS
jgi:hypothetical protein